MAATAAARGSCRASFRGCILFEASDLRASRWGRRITPHGRCISGATRCGARLSPCAHGAGASRRSPMHRG
eukprot:8232453-Pyramimonas_sp.AAC.1